MLCPRRLLPAPDVPLSREVDRAPAVELEDGRRQRLEEPAVVGDEDHRGVDRAQQLLEPLDRLDVEVVGGLVEQQEVGLRGERAAERGPRELAARERRQGPVEVGVGEPEPPDDRGRPVAPVVAAGVLEPGLRGRVAGERPGVVGARRHRLLELAQLLLERGEIGRAGEHVVAEPELARRRRPLVVERDARPLLPRELAALERDASREGPQERCLAGAVRAGERQPVAALDLERDAVEERGARELLAQPGSDHDCHLLHLFKRSDPVRRRARRPRGTRRRRGSRPHRSRPASGWHDQGSCRASGRTAPSTPVQGEGVSA